MLFWNAGIMGRKEQLLEAIFGSMRSSKEVTATSRRHHVATSPSHDVGSTNAEVNNSATSRRQLENLHLIIKCQRARKRGHREAYDGRHRFQETEDPDFESFPGIRTVFRFC